MNYCNPLLKERERFLEAWAKDASRWKCDCGAVCNPCSPDWRWNGMEWEHKHEYPVGHIPAIKYPEDPHAA